MQKILLLMLLSISALAMHPSHADERLTPEQKELYTDVPGLTNPPVDYPATYGKATVTDKDGNTIEL